MTTADSAVTGPGVRPAGSIPAGGAWLRIGLAAVVAALLVTSWIPPNPPALGWVQVGVMVVLGLATVCAPGTLGVTLLLGGVVTVRFITGEGRVDATLFVLAVLVPLCHQLAGLAAAVPVWSRLHLRALLPSLVRYLIVTVLTVLALVIAQGIS